MNELPEKNNDPYRSFLLMSEIEKEETLSQRELSQRLGIALGLVNSYLKNLVGKGFVRVKTFPRNRYAYLLTPKGIAEKSRLAYQHLNYFTSLYTVTRQDFLTLFEALGSKGLPKVAFCGVDEVAEIAYLSLCEAGLDLALILDDDLAGEKFFGRTIVTLSEGKALWEGPMIITSLKKGEALREQMLLLGVNSERILMASALA